MNAWLRGVVVSIVAATVAPHRGGGATPVRMDLQVEASESEPSKGSMTVRGVMTWSEDASEPEGGRVRCLYLPLNDPYFTDNWQRTVRFDLSGGLSSFPDLGAGTRILDLATAEAKPIILDVTPDASGTYRVRFESDVPALETGSSEERMFHGFHPRMLSECPAQRLVRDRDSRWQVRQDLEYRVELAVPGGWQALAPQPFAIGSEFAFILARNVEVDVMHLDDLQVNIAYRSEGFAQEISSTLREAVQMLRESFGALPTRSLTLYESRNFIDLAVPGLLALNQPRQWFFRQLQQKWLNIRQWMLASQLSSHWLHAQFRAASLDDMWLTEGLSDLVASDIVERLVQRRNIFNVFGTGLSLPELSYLQVHDISAATLERAASLSSLTDSTLRSSAPRTAQHPLLFVRQVMALRHVRSLIGNLEFAAFVRSIPMSFPSRYLSPREFADVLRDYFNRVRPAWGDLLAEILAQWWSQHEWPDFAIENVTTSEQEGHGWIVHVTVKQDAPYSFAVPFEVKDSEGQRRSATLDRKSEGIWEGTVHTTRPPEEIVVDPDRTIYDRDRFNNSTGWPSVRFFPGSARTLYDHDYTVFWAPIAFRRPSEGFGLGLTGALFRYTRGVLVGRLETLWGQNTFAYSLRTEQLVSKYALRSTFEANRDHRNHQVFAASLARDPLLDTNPRPSVSGLLRHRNSVGDFSSRHATWTMAGQLATQGAPDPCGAKLLADYEHAPGAWNAEGFSYGRFTSSLNPVCYLGRGVDLGLRGFYGALLSPKQPPALALFLPTAGQEAQMRIELGKPVGSWSFAAINLDLKLPLPIPLPSDLMVITRRMKLLVFGDIGESRVPTSTYRDAGTGLVIPFGGDVVGGGPLSLLHLNVLVILYSRQDDVISRAPSVVFELAGAL